MLKFLFRGVLSALALQMLNNSRRLSVQLLKIEVAKSYLRGVRLVKSTTSNLMRIGLVIGLVFVGVVLFHAGLFILLPWTLQLKALFGVLLGLGYMSIGGMMLHRYMDERWWIKASGAAELIAAATDSSGATGVEEL